MSCTTLDICTASVSTKPRTQTEAQLNWTLLSMLQKWICCFQDMEIITDAVFKVFPNIETPTQTFDIGIDLPAEQYIEVEWNGQDRYPVGQGEPGEVMWAISGTQIVFTEPVGMPGNPCWVTVKVLLKEKVKDALNCPALETPSCLCDCGC